MSWTMDPPPAVLAEEAIETEEQARNWVIELVTETEALRRACDFCPDVKGQRTAFMRWLLKRGETLGVLYALQRTRRLGDTAFHELRKRVLATHVPTVQAAALPFGQ